MLILPPRVTKALALVAAAAGLALAVPEAGAAATRWLVVWKVGPERFRTYLTRPADVARVKAAIRAKESAGIPIGRIVRGTRENTGHAWHLRDVRLADVTIELCDGRPSDLDRDLGYWLTQVKRYCPWSARPVRITKAG